MLRRSRSAFRSFSVLQWQELLAKAVSLPKADVAARPNHLSVYSYTMQSWIDREHFDHHPPRVDVEKRSAVLLLLAPQRVDDGCSELCFPVTMRSQKLRSHAGQMSLPGGRCDPGETAEQAAIRETEEEIGVVASNYSVVGNLPDVWSYPGKCWVTPVVALAPHPIAPRINSPDEVDQIFYCHLDALLFESSKTHFRLEKHYSKNWGGSLTMPCFLAPPDLHQPAIRYTGPAVESEEGRPSVPVEPSDRVDLQTFGATHGLVWGLTALMISNLLTRLAHPLVTNERLQGAPVVFGDPESRGTAKDGGG